MFRSVGKRKPAEPLALILNRTWGPATWALWQPKAKVPAASGALGKLCKSYCAAHLFCRVLARRSPLYLICLATRSAASRILACSRHFCRASLVVKSANRFLKRC